jgi:lysophospholipid acyltransferase (LPLAT)-like uncharacterized protein
MVRWLSRTWRTEVLGGEHLDRLEAEGGYLIAMWHGRMLVGVHHHSGRPWHILVSPSADGDLSDRLLRAFGYQVVRGSSSRSGARALRAMLAVLDGGGSLVVTPDGPRGPRHSMNPGLAWMSRATGYPILPMGLVGEPAWRMDSWDRFTIPKLRSRVVISYQEPLRVPREATPEDLERATEVLRERILAAEMRAYQHLGQEIDW